MQSSRGLDAPPRCRLALLPPPESLEGVWAAVAGLPRLRRLDLSHSHTVAPSHLALLAALPALEALDLTGVHLPLSALAPLETLTAVTQLRIPNVKVRLRCEPHACAVPAGGIPAFTGAAPWGAGVALDSRMSMYAPNLHALMHSHGQALGVAVIDCGRHVWTKMSLITKE